MILDFKNSQIPQHNNTFAKNKTLYWSGCDRKELWESNMKDSSNYDYFVSRGWDNEYAIEYKFNSHGFRTDEFDERIGYLALGCSFTEGVGLPSDSVWPTLLADKLKTHIWNLGVGGSSLDTCFRLLDYYISKMSVKGVFLLQPPDDRFEIHTPSEIISLSHPMPLPTYETHMLKLWLSNDNNSKYNITKNLLAMKQICDSHDVFFVHRRFDDLFACPPVLTPADGGYWARDMLHAGDQNQKHITDLFYKDYNNGTTKSN